MDSKCKELERLKAERAALAGTRSCRIGAVLGETFVQQLPGALAQTNTGGVTGKDLHNLIRKHSAPHLRIFSSDAGVVDWKYDPNEVWVK